MPKSNPLHWTTARPALIEPQTAASAPPRRTSAWKRHTAVWSRWLHIYLSMVSFAILFFFGVTGFTLNHQDWFNGQQQTVQVQGKLPAAWAQPSAEESKLWMVEYFRQKHGIHAALSDFRSDDRQCDLAFKGPGYSADITIDRKSGTYELTENRMGFAAIVNDLHKGRDTGPAWSLVMDLTAIFMTLVAASGIVLICFLHRRRLSGLLAALAGAGMCWFVYRVWVP